MAESWGLPVNSQSSPQTWMERQTFLLIGKKKKKKLRLALLTEGALRLCGLAWKPLFSVNWCHYPVLAVWWLSFLLGYQAEAPGLLSGPLLSGHLQHFQLPSGLLTCDQGGCLEASWWKQLFVEKLLGAFTLNIVPLQSDSHCTDRGSCTFLCAVPPHMPHPQGGCLFKTSPKARCPTPSASCSQT